MPKKFTSEEEKHLYASWKFMRRVCTNDKAKDYATYGGRGIKVCKKWNDFDTFMLWALGNGYELGKVLTRKDSNGDFTPENCCFAGKSEAKTSIRTSSRIVEYKGKQYTNAEFARELGMNPHTTLKYLNAGHTPEVIEAMRYETSWRSMVEEDNSYLAKVSSELLKDRKYVKKILGFNPETFFGLPKAMQGDKELVKFVLTQDPSLLLRLPQRIQSDREVLYTALKSDITLYDALSPNMQKKRVVRDVAERVREELPIPWPEIYAAWTAQAQETHLSDNVEVTSVLLNFTGGYDYLSGYDWRSSGFNAERYANDSYGFFFERHANEGTNTTAARLAEAKTDEERAAIWVAATIRELFDTRRTPLRMRHYLERIRCSATEFVQIRDWHYPMKKWVPEIYIEQEELDKVNEGDLNAVIRLIQKNTAEVQCNYRIFYYFTANAPRAAKSD